MIEFSIKLIERPDIAPEAVQWLVDADSSTFTAAEAVAADEFIEMYERMKLEQSKRLGPNFIDKGSVKIRRIRNDKTDTSGDIGRQTGD